jgi:HTH-type transcriptional regulator/antitoxin HipB
MTPTDLGLHIRAARRSVGLRQDELAAAAGVGLRFLVELERGKSTAQLGKILQVLDALGLTLTVAPRTQPVMAIRA